jgi:hypothetical protein
MKKRERKAEHGLEFFLQRINCGALLVRHLLVYL